MLRAFFDAGPVARAVVGPELRVEDANDAFGREHVGKAIDEILPAASPPLGTVVGRVLESGVPVDQFELADAEGLRHWFGSVFPIEAGAMPRRVGVVLRDVTETGSGEQQFRSLIESALEAMVAVDAAGRIIFVNGAAVRLFGYPRDELVGETVEKLIAPNLHARHTGFRTDYMQAPRARPMGADLALTALRKDGTELPVDISLSPFDAAERPFVVATVRDLTRLRTAESDLVAANASLEQRVEERTAQLIEAIQAIEQANTAKNEFLANLSHELRTPLNAILGFAQLLALAELEEDDAEAVGHVLASGRHMLFLVDEVLDIARIEAGELTFSIERTELDPLVREAFELVAPRAQSRSVELRLPDDLGGLAVEADRERLLEVLLNLLTNAVKYNREGGSVEVSVERRDARLRISVRDTGAGIPDAEHGRLFEPFERLESHGAIEGAGLGLALTKRLVEAMGGSIGVRSRLGEGSVFWVQLPAAD